LTSDDGGDVITAENEPAAGELYKTQDYNPSGPDLGPAELDSCLHSQASK